MMKKLVIFDMDGVIVDSTELSKREFLKNHPGMTEEYYKEMCGGNFYEELAKARHIHPQVEMTEKEEKRMQKLYSEKKLSSSIFPGIKELLKSLHQKGYVLALNTSAYIPNTIPILQKAEIEKLFDFIGTAEVSKNKVEKFDLIQQKYNIKKENSIFITDSLSDLKEAHKVGMKTIAVTWGVHSKDYFIKEDYKNLVAVVETVQELESYIELSVV